MRFLRQLGMVLVAILAQRWLAAALAFCLIMPWLNAPGFVNQSVSRISIVDQPPVPADTAANVIPPERLVTTRDWYAIGTPQYLIGLPGGDRHGDWEILDRLPALERLWLDGPQVTKEGWRRIGEHPALELLSLLSVHVPS